MDGTNSSTPVLVAPLSPADILPGHEALSSADTSVDRIAIDDIEYLSDDEAIVTWSWVHSGFVTVSRVDLEYEGADPSVGVGAYVHVHGDLPHGVEDHVAESASLRMADRADDRDEYEPDGSFEYADEDRYAGGQW